MDKARMLEGFLVGFFVGIPAGVLLLPTLVLLLHIVRSYLG